MFTNQYQLRVILCLKLRRYFSDGRIMTEETDLPQKPKIGFSFHRNIGGKREEKVTDYENRLV